MYEFRKAIDTIDSQIIELLYHRSNIVANVKRFKESIGDHDDFRLFIKPDREFLMIQNICNNISDHHYPKDFYTHMWRHIISSSNMIEQGNLKITCIGNDNILNAHKHYPSFTIEVEKNINTALHNMIDNNTHILAFKHNDEDFYTHLLEANRSDIMIFSASPMYSSTNTIFFCGKIVPDEPASDERIYICAGQGSKGDAICIINNGIRIFKSKTPLEKVLGFVYPNLF